jgi:hypothetical protein
MAAEPSGASRPITAEQDYYWFECPHCSLIVQVGKADVNCALFRHAADKQTLQQIGPHTSEAECKRLFDSGAVVGCARPFRMNMATMQAEVCGYI